MDCLSISVVFGSPPAIYKGKSKLELTNTLKQHITMPKLEGTQACLGANIKTWHYIKVLRDESS